MATRDNAATPSLTMRPLTMIYFQLKSLDCGGNHSRRVFLALRDLQSDQREQLGGIPQ